MRDEPPFQCVTAASEAKRWVSSWGEAPSVYAYPRGRTVRVTYLDGQLVDASLYHPPEVASDVLVDVFRQLGGVPVRLQTDVSGYLWGRVTWSRAACQRWWFRHGCLPTGRMSTCLQGAARHPRQAGYLSFYGGDGTWTEVSVHRDHLWDHLLDGHDIRRMVHHGRLSWEGVARLQEHAQTDHWDWPYILKGWLLRPPRAHRQRDSGPRSILWVTT